MTQNKVVQVEGFGEQVQINKTVKFLATMKVKDTQEAIFTTGHPQRAVVGQNQINSVLESYILTMKKEQKSVFILSNEEIQGITRTQTHKDKIVELVLEIVDIEDVIDLEKYLSRQSKEKKASELKIQGNQLIKVKNYPQCITRYLEAYRLVEFNTTEQGKELKHSLLLNLSLAYINNKQYDLALEYSQRILRQDPLHLKALYRKASSLRYLGEFDRSVRQIKKVLDQNPDNKQFSGLLKEIKEHQEANKKKQKQLYGKMFGN